MKVQNLNCLKRQAMVRNLIHPHRHHQMYRATQMVIMMIIYRKMMLKLQCESECMH